MRLRNMSIVLAIASLVVGSLATNAVAAPPPGRVYLALGDSLAASFQPNGDTHHGYAEQLFENLVVHGQQLAVALVETLALAGQLAELLPGVDKVIALGLWITRQQLLHGAVATAQLKSGEHFAAALRACLGLVDQRQDLFIEQVDLPAVALEQLLIQLLHQTTQGQIVGAVLMQVLLDDLQQLLLTRGGHASLPLW